MEKVLDKLGINSLLFKSMMVRKLDVQHNLMQFSGEKRRSISKLISLATDGNLCWN